MKNWFTTIKQDFQAAVNRDPAVQTPFEVLLVYTTFHVIFLHRIYHALWKAGFRLTARFLSQITRNLTGIEIHPAAQIGPGFFIDHGSGVVIGETTEIGRNVTMYHGVTLGGVSLEKGKRHPTIEDNVVIGAGAKILGAITIGEGSRIGANAVVVQSAPCHSIVVGVPGKVIKRTKPHLSSPDLDHSILPDTVEKTIELLINRIDRLESELESQRAVDTETLIEQVILSKKENLLEHAWTEEDFVI